MKNKSTKRALMTSALSLLLCVSMLVGTTFAWFTDSVTSGRNQIVAGNLDVELYYSVLDENGEWTDYDKVTENTKVFNYNLWEPGYTQVAKFKIVNEGSLALKYQLTADVYTELPGKTKTGADIKLSDHLLYGVTEDLTVLENRADAAAAATNSFDSFEVKAASLEKGAAAEVGIVITMPTTVGNEANHDGVHIPSIEFGINLVATQMTEESDSFGNDYDTYSAYIQVTPDTFEQVLANLKDGDQLYLQAGTYKVSSNEKLKIVKNNITIVGADVDRTIIDAEDKTCSGQAALLIDGDNVTLKNLTVKSASTDGNVAAIKFTNLSEPSRIISGGTIENVVVYGGAGHGINLHGVDGVTINAADVRSYGKCAIACAMATDVTVSGTKTTAGGWGADLGAMYGNSDAYATPSTITIKADNSFGNGKVYTERPATAAGGADTLIFEEPAAWVKAVNGDEISYSAAAASVGDNSYLTIGEALNAAQPGDTVLVFDGTYTDLTVAKSSITVKGSENVIFTGTITVDGTANNVVLDSINLNYQGENLSNPGYGNVVIWGDNCTLKNCDFVAKYNPNDSQAIGYNFGMVRFNYGLNGTVENCTFKTNTMGMFPAMKTGKISGCTFEPIDERRPMAINCTDMWGVEISNNTFYGLRILTNGNMETFSKNKFLDYQVAGYPYTIFVTSYIGCDVSTTIDLSGNYFGENPNFDQLLGTDGKVTVNTYYSDEAMTTLVSK